MAQARSVQARTGGGPATECGSHFRSNQRERKSVNPVGGADGGGWRGSSAAPLTLLLLALATVFLFGGGRSHFNYPEGTHDNVTLNHMMVALNLSPEHDFLGFYYLYLDDAGEPTYRPYNRFPVLGHALIKLATLPFPDDVSARLSAARMLMLAFFAAAAALAHLALCRLTSSRWAALAATLLSFSSYYALYYNDMVATEGVVGLFGLMLVLHGMAAFATEGRFGQLLAKTCAALLLDWHVYALLMPFALLGLAAAARRRDGLGFRRHLTLGAVALVFGSLVLAANFTREWAALGGETPVAELPSVRSMLHRTGIAPKWRHPFGWTEMAEEQLGRIGAASVPYALSHFIDGKPSSRGITKMRIYVALGSVLSILTVLACLAQFLSPPPHAPLLPLTALALSGPCWTVAVYYNSRTEFEGMFYIGIPLAFFALLLPRLDRLLDGRVSASVLAGVAAAPMFVLSSFLMARSINPDPEHVAYTRAVAADVDSIRKLVEGKTIFTSKVDACEKEREWPMKWWLRRQTTLFYFTGSVFVSYANRHLADFVVGDQLEGARPLTPGHRWLFLYDRVNYDAALGWWERRAKHGAPVLESPDWEVHLVKGGAGRHLLYFDDHCPDHRINDARVFAPIIMGGSTVFLHAWPADANDLPAGRRQFGFDGLVNFENVLPGWGKEKDGECYFLCRLPDYGIARIHTGWTSKGRQYEVIWEGSFSPDSDQVPQAGLPAAPPRPLLQPMAQQE